MSVGLLLISHNGVASHLLETARKMLGTTPLATRVLDVPFDAPVDMVQQQAQDYVKMLDKGHGVLILADLYGSTPCNIGKNLLVNSGFKLVSGLNLPMLVRILNYPELDLDAMAEKAVTGGKDGILLCDCE
jgi:PTS system ascorbate-specific IIA component